MYIRPIKESDLEGLYHLAKLSKPGLTTLSKDKGVLKELIDLSCKSFASNVTIPKKERYVFALIDNHHNLCGISSIIARIGCNDPFYSYKIHSYTRESKTVNKSKLFRVLQLDKSFMGPTEIGTLFLDPKYRGQGLGKLLSLSRFLFIAAYPHRFDSTIIAEMRGVSNEVGVSPFWESLGKKFFNMDFIKADFLSSQNKSFIHDLMPRNPIYIDLLEPAAQQAIGEPHQLTVPAWRVLEKEGFKKTNSIDIFDGGPKVSCLTKKIKTISNSKRYVVKNSPVIPDAKPYLIGRIGQETAFRAGIFQAMPVLENHNLCFNIHAESKQLFSQGDPIIGVDLSRG